MALITSAATGNFSAGATWTGGVVPTVGDEARASTGHTVTINVNTTCDEVSNAGTGTFILASGITLTANVTNKSSSVSTCVQFTAATPASGSIIGNCTGGSVAANTAAAANTSSGTLNITGNCLATSQFCHGGTNTSTGTLNITGNCTGGGLSQQAHGANNGSTGTLNITGNCTGGTSPSGSGSFGALNNSTGTLNITGNCTGGSGASCAGVSNNTTGTVTITGNVVGGSGSTCAGVINSTGTTSILGTATGGTVSTSTGVNNTSTGTINLTRAKGSAYGPGNTSGLAASVGASNVGLGVIQIEELEYGDYGMSPTSGTGIRLKKANSNVAVFNYCDTAGAKTLIDATQNAAMPAASNVRSGVSYASGALTGSCAVPAAGSVALGVPVDATTGTAVLTPSAVWEYATREITGGVVDTLTNSPDVPTEAEIATAVWGASTKEITGGTVTNLTNAPASVTPADIWDYNDRTLTSASGPTAVEIRQEIDANSSKLDVAVGTRLAGSAYTAPANSDVAAIKAKTDALPSDPADQSLLEAAIAGVTAPSASTVATAVRTELATELARVDAAISTRLADADYVAPANSDVAAVKAVTDALNTERLANVATTAIVGNLLAQANS